MKKEKKQKWFKRSYVILLLIAVISVSMNIRVGTLNPRFAVFTEYGSDAFVTFLGHDYVTIFRMPKPYVINAEIDKVNYLHWSESDKFWNAVIGKVHEVYMYKNDPNHWILTLDEDIPSMDTEEGLFRDDLVLPNRNDNEINRIVLSGKQNEENIKLPAFSIEDKKVIQEIFNSVQEGKRVPFTIEKVTKKMKPGDYEGYYEMYIEYKDYPIIEMLGNLTMENDKVMIEWATRASAEEIAHWPHSYDE